MSTTKNKPKAENVEPYNVWNCLTCAGNPEFEHYKMMEHLKAVHGVKEMKGKRSLSMHMDGDTWFSYVWKWEIGDVKAVQSTRDNRTGENLAMWSGERGKP